MQEVLELEGSLSGKNVMLLSPQHWRAAKAYAEKQQGSGTRKPVVYCLPKQDLVVLERTSKYRQSGQVARWMQGWACSKCCVSVPHSLCRPESQVWDRDYVQRCGQQRAARLLYV